MSISTPDDAGEILTFNGQTLTSTLSTTTGSSVSLTSNPSSSSITTTTINPVTNDINEKGGVVGEGITADTSSLNSHSNRQYSTSHQRRFHRRFPAIDQHEKLIDWYSCALVDDILLQGYLYISENYFAFYSNIVVYKTQLLIPICDVISVTKEKTAKIFPNAVGIVTDQTKYVFGSLLSRESTFRLMQEVWKATLIQVVSIPYLSPVIQLDKMIKNTDDEITLKIKPKQKEDEKENISLAEDTESIVPLNSPDSLTPSTTNNINSDSNVQNSQNAMLNAQSISGLFNNPFIIKPHHPETIKLVNSEIITSTQKVIPSTTTIPTTHNQQSNEETDSSGSEFETNSDAAIYEDSYTNLINNELSSSSNFKLSSHKNPCQSKLVHLSQYHRINWIIKGKRLLTTLIKPYPQILWNQITDTSRLLIMTTTLLVMLFLSVLIFLYRIEQVHDELLSLQQTTQTNDFNQVQSKQIELMKEIKTLVNSLEEKTVKLSVIKERIEEILNSYNHLSTCST